MNLLSEIVHVFNLLILIQVVSSKIISLNDGKITYDYDDSKCLYTGGSGNFFIGKKFDGNKTDAVAIKVARNVRKIGYLNAEKRIYQAIGDYDSIPKLYHHFSTVTQSTIITGLLGEVLDDLFEKVKRFSTVTVLRIGLQVLDILEHIHKKGVIHYDIHLGNLAVGFHNDSKIYLFDFDMAKEYKMIGETILFNGTFDCPYHLRSPRNDIKELAAMLILTLRYDIPSSFIIDARWRNKEITNEEFDKYIYSDVDCKETMLEFSRMSQDPKHDQPDYEAFRNLLRTELEKHKDEPNYDKFDWQITDNI